MNRELIRDMVGWALEESHRREPEYPSWYGPLDFWRAWDWTTRLAVIAAGVTLVLIAFVLVTALLALGPQPQTGGPR